MSKRDRLISRMGSLNNSLNDPDRSKVSSQSVLNNIAANSHTYKKDGEVGGGYTTIVSNTNDIVIQEKDSIPDEVTEGLDVIQLHESAKSSVLTKTVSSSHKTDMTAITGKEDLAKGGFLDVVISSPYPEALGHAFKNVTNAPKADVESIMRNNINGVNHDDEAVVSVVENVYDTKISANQVLNQVVGQIKRLTNELNSSVNKGFGSGVENIIESTFLSAQSKLSPILYKNNVAQHISDKDLKRVVEAVEGEQWQKAYKILKQYSDSSETEIIAVLKTIDNSAVTNISEATATVDMDTQRTDNYKNLWRETETPADGTVFQPLIGSELVVEVANMEREVTEIIIVYLPKKGTTITEYHNLYSTQFSIGFNPHFYIGSDAVAYRGRPLEIEASNKSRIITNNHYKRSILISVNVDETSTAHKVSAEQVDRLVNVIGQIYQAIPGIQVFSAADVGWEYSADESAIDLEPLLKTRLGIVNSELYKPKDHDPMTQSQLAEIGF